MNIFQLILHDPNHRSSSSLNSMQQNWSLFNKDLQSLQTGTAETLPLIMQSGRNLWSNIILQPAQIKIFHEHYTYYVKELATNILLTRIQAINASSSSAQSKLLQTLTQIHKTYSFHAQYLTIIDQNQYLLSTLVEQIRKLLSKTAILPSLQLVVQHTYSQHCIKIFKQDIIYFDQQVKEYLINKCQKQSSMAVQQHQVRMLFDQLQSMKLLSYFMDSVQMFFVKDCEQFLLNSCDIQSSSKFLTHTLNYHKIFQKSFSKKITSGHTQQSITKSIASIQHSVYFLCAKLCSKNILQIVLDFPESHQVIIVLKKCLDQSHLLAQLAQQLYMGIKKRLLIPGILTQNILNQYLNMLKVLQVLDPNGIVFDKITTPIKNYLLKRNDTLRCIISHMTQNGQISSGLTREMVRIPSNQYIDEASSDQNQKAAEQWQVLNLKESKKRIRVKYQETDLATVLVNLYGSQQAFITEYQNMLAEKLMSAKTYQIEEEIKNVELIKMRFGQNALQNCNVILKDVKDSKKNDKDIHKEKAKYQKGQFTMDQMHCLAVSKGYWPINYDNTTNSFELPESIKPVFDEYAVAFSKLKAMRKIQYHNSLGHANLTLTFKNGSFDFKCLPIHAVIINYFDEDKMKDAHNGISSEELSASLHVAPNVIKQKMSFWVHKGVIKQIRQPKVGLSLKRLNSIEDVELVFYKPVDEYVSIPRDEMQDDDVDEFISKQNTSTESHLKHIIEGLILSILNINGPKSHQKIHLLLKTVYKTDLDYSYSENHTIEILKKMVQKKKISFSGETYSKISK